MKKKNEQRETDGRFLTNHAALLRKTTRGSRIPTALREVIPPLPPQLTRPFAAATHSLGEEEWNLVSADTQGDREEADVRISARQQGSDVERETAHCARNRFRPRRLRQRVSKLSEIGQRYIDRGPRP